MAGDKTGCLSLRRVMELKSSFTDKQSVQGLKFFSLKWLTEGPLKGPICFQFVIGFVVSCHRLIALSRVQDMMTSQGGNLYLGDGGLAMSISSSPWCLLFCGKIDCSTTLLISAWALNSNMPIREARVSQCGWRGEKSYLVPRISSLAVSSRPPS